MNTKKIIGWVVGVVVLVVLGFYIAMSNSGNSNPVDTTANSAGGMPSPSGDATTTPAGTPADGTSTGTTPTASGAYKDGVYTGPVTDAVYGSIQVVATIKGGKLVDTECPIQPNSSGHTTQISQSSLPILKQEAIASQSANVNIVSGATQTSEGYQQSLGAALAMAKN
jgi:uncharacterized protein with FMN-binding domain